MISASYTTGRYLSFWLYSIKCAQQSSKDIVLFNVQAHMVYERQGWHGGRGQRHQVARRRPGDVLRLVAVRCPPGPLASQGRLPMGRWEITCTSVGRKIRTSLTHNNYYTLYECILPVLHTSNENINVFCHFSGFFFRFYFVFFKINYCDLLMVWVSLIVTLNSLFRKTNDIQPVYCDYRWSMGVKPFRRRGTSGGHLWTSGPRGVPHRSRRPGLLYGLPIVLIVYAVLDITACNC